MELESSAHANISLRQELVCQLHHLHPAQHKLVSLCQKLSQIMTSFRTLLLVALQTLLLCSVYGVAVSTDTYTIGGGDLNNSVRAEQCIANSTHCHCSTQPRKTNSCVKPSETEAGKCSMGTCLGGLRCDCASGKICKKAVRTLWNKVGDVSAASAGSFACEESKAPVPAEVIGFSADFEVNADGAFTLYVDGMAVSAGEGTLKNTFHSTAQLYASSVVAVEVFDSSAKGPALKLRYNIDGTEHSKSCGLSACKEHPSRFSHALVQPSNRNLFSPAPSPPLPVFAFTAIDDTWKASIKRESGFQLAAFDDSAWAKPVDAKRDVAGLDAEVNWKGAAGGSATASDELFMRRVVPDSGPSA